MTQDEVLKTFRDTGASLEGHFILRSGLRSRHHRADARWIGYWPGSCQATRCSVHLFGKRGANWSCGAAANVDRSNGTVNFDVPFQSLIALKVENFEPSKLPPDIAKITVEKPGSK